MNHLIRFVILLSCVLMTPLAAEELKFELSDFYGGQSSLRLQGRDTQANISIPLSPIMEVSQAVLDLKAISSITLLKDYSVLSVRFNNATIAQIEYDPNRPNVNSRIVIPPQLWRPGYNNLTLSASQQNTPEACADTDMPDLWSEINLAKSTLSISTNIKDRTPSLQSLSGFFNPGIGGQTHVTLFSPESNLEQMSASAMPLVAQALALRNQYQPLTITHQPLDLEATHESSTGIASYMSPDEAGKMHVLVGDKASLTDLLSAAELEQITGPYLALDSVLASDELTTVYRLVVSGQTTEEVAQAAQTLALMDDELNPDRSIISQGSDSSAGTLLQTHIQHPGNEYSFQELNSLNETFRDKGAFNKRVNITLPADFYVPENVKVKLFLDFAYGAALGEASMMNILVNGKVIHGVKLENQNGESFDNYQLNIPARYFSGGHNTLDFAITLQKPNSGKFCSTVDSSHMVFQIHDSSTLVFPNAASVAIQPDLKLWSTTSYPMTQFNTSSPNNIYIAEPAMLSAALTLAGKMAQVSGVPNLALGIINELGDLMSKNAVVLATPEKLNDTLFDNYEAAISAIKKWPYRMQNELHNRVKDLLPTEKQRPLKVTGHTEQMSTLGDQAVLMAVKNPLHEDTGTLFIITAETTQLINSRMFDLVHHDLWGQLAGDFMTWDNPEAPLLVMRVADTYQVGDEPTDWLALRLWLSNNPVYWLVAVLGLTAFAALIALVLLRRRLAKIKKEW